MTYSRLLTACPSEPPSPPDHTTLEGPERDPPYWVGSRVWYKCEEGLATPNGWEAVSLTCSLESEWGQLDIQCEPGECMYSTLNNDTQSHMLTQFCDTLFPFPSMLHLSTALFLSSYNPIHLKSLNVQRYSPSLLIARYVPFYSLSLGASAL